MKPCLILLLLLPFLVETIHAQDSQIEIWLRDKTSGADIRGAHCETSLEVFISDSRGKVIVKASPADTLRISHIGYRDTTIRFLKETKSRLTLYLIPESQTLETAEVNAKPFEIFAPKRTNVFDFEWLRDTLMVLTYTREQMMRRAGLQGVPLYLGCKLLQVSSSGSVLKSIPLPDHIIGFYFDPREKLFVISQNSVYLVQSQSDKIRLIEFDKAQFEEEVQPLTAVTKSALFLENYTPDYPEFSYFAHDPKTEKQERIRTIRDDFTMELFRASYKYMSNFDKLRAIRMEEESGIDKEIYGAFMTGFQQSPYYHSLYAPLFANGDSIFIFDPYTRYLYIHNSRGIPIDSLGTDYQDADRDNFDDLILHDRKTNRVYAVFRKSGIPYLREISLQTGDCENIIRLYYTYPEKIKVHQGRIYYLYRATGSTRTKHLFAEDL